MKNKLLTLAGILALVALLGKFYAVPAIAQAIRAAVVKNIDEPARGTLADGFTGLGNLAAEPSNTRLVTAAAILGLFYRLYK